MRFHQRNMISGMFTFRRSCVHVPSNIMSQRNKKTNSECEQLTKTPKNTVFLEKNLSEICPKKFRHFFPKYFPPKWAIYFKIPTESESFRASKVVSQSKRGKKWSNCRIPILFSNFRISLKNSIFQKEKSKIFKRTVLQSVHWTEMWGYHAKIHQKSVENPQTSQIRNRNSPKFVDFKQLWDTQKSGKCGNLLFF
jgi:hypothetical protein